MRNDISTPAVCSTKFPHGECAEHAAGNHRRRKRMIYMLNRFRDDLRVNIISCINLSFNDYSRNTSSGDTRQMRRHYITEFRSGVSRQSRRMKKPDNMLAENLRSQMMR